MRVLAKAFVGVTTAVGIAVGGLAAGGTAVAAPVPLQQQVVSADAVAPLAVNNLGLTTAEAKKVQRWLRDVWTYTGALDGLLGTESWRAFQEALQWEYGYTGALDGIVGPNTIRSLQRLLEANGYYGGAIDGIAGSGTRAAFKAWANGF